MSTENNQNESRELLQLVSFFIGNEEFGIEIVKVQEIIRLIKITEIPNSPEFVDGVINLRDRIIPVIDLRIKLGMLKIEHNSSTKIIVIEIDNKTVGFIVDAVSKVLRIPLNITEPPPKIVNRINSEYITAIGKLEDRLLILLDLKKILTLEEKEALKKIV